VGNIIYRYTYLFFIKTNTNNIYSRSVYLIIDTDNIKTPRWVYSNDGAMEIGDFYFVVCFTIHLLWRVIF